MNLKSGLIILLTGIAITVGSLECSADATSDLLIEMQKKIESLENRLERQEQQNRVLQERLDELENVQQQVEQVEEKIERLPSTKDKPISNAIRSKYDTELYGYIKLDLSYDEGKIDSGNYARWVLPDGENDDQFNITANQTRLGLKMAGPEIGEGKSGGRVEVDFFEGGSENKARLMMRHAFLSLNWPDSDFSLLAGQTSDVISPLVPTTLNYPVSWWAGDIGYRRPQLRLTKGWDITDRYGAMLQLAAARTIGDDTTFGAGDTGEDSGFPSIQGRLAFDFPLWTKKNGSLGLSGHWGEEEYDHPTGGMDLDTWSAGFDVVFPLTEWLVFSGEGFTGENLDAYLGGIAQGITVTSNNAGVVTETPNAKNFTGALLGIEEIKSTGGWFQLAFGPFDKWMFHVGASVDDPENSDLASNTSLDVPSRNTALWGNVFYDWNEAVRVGLEVSHWDTEYEGGDEADSYRIQNSFIYKF